MCTAMMRSVFGIPLMLMLFGFHKTTLKEKLHGQYACNKTKKPALG
jgi:hypothetical protein